MFSAEPCVALRNAPVAPCAWHNADTSAGIWGHGRCVYQLQYFQINLLLHLKVSTFNQNNKNMDKIEEGDYVRHNDPRINGGLVMTVEKIDDEGTHSFCSHFVGPELVHKSEWFDTKDLILVNKVQGGFVQ